MNKKGGCPNGQPPFFIITTTLASERFNQVKDSKGTILVQGMLMYVE
jgi:hypothetical protein